MCVFKTCTATGLSTPCAVNPYATRLVHAVRVIANKIACEVKPVYVTRRKHSRERDGRREEGRRRSGEGKSRGGERGERRGRREKKRDRIGDEGEGAPDNHLGASFSQFESSLNVAAANKSVVGRSVAEPAAPEHLTPADVELLLQCSLGGAASGDALEWRKDDQRMDFHSREVKLNSTVKLIVNCEILIVI